jgi:hypothetical protein
LRAPPDMLRTSNLTKTLHHHSRLTVHTMSHCIACVASRLTVSACHMSPSYVVRVPSSALSPSHDIVRKSHTQGGLSKTLELLKATQNKPSGHSTCHSCFIEHSPHHVPWAPQLHTPGRPMTATFQWPPHNTLSRWIHLEPCKNQEQHWFASSNSNTPYPYPCSHHTHKTHSLNGSLHAGSRPACTGSTLALEP